MGKSQPAWGRAGVPSLDLSGLTEPEAVVAVSARSLTLSSDSKLIGTAHGKGMVAEVASGEKEAMVSPAKRQSESANESNAARKVQQDRTQKRLVAKLRRAGL